MASSRKSRRLLIGVAVVLAIGAVAVGVAVWKRAAALPAPGSALYEEYAEAFEVGTAALDVGRDDVVLVHLNRAIEKIPQEPAAWANRGLFYLRHGQLKEAAGDLNKAH